MGMKYIFGEVVTLTNANKADPQVIGEALEAIRKKSGGTLKPQTVVEEAQAPRHPLHKHFEWSDALAASRFRIEQARELIRSVRIVGDDNDNCPRAFHSIRSNGHVAYYDYKSITTSETLQARLLEDAERDARAWADRLEGIKDLCSDFRRISNKIAARRAKTATGKTARAAA